MISKLLSDIRCEAETTDSELFGTYYWSETESGQVASLECIEGSNNVTRSCLTGGIWSTPSFFDCGSYNANFVLV